MWIGSTYFKTGMTFQVVLCFVSHTGKDIHVSVICTQLINLLPLPLVVQHVMVTWWWVFKV